MGINFLETFEFYTHESEQFADCRHWSGER